MTPRAQRGTHGTKPFFISTWTTIHTNTQAYTCACTTSFPKLSPMLSPTHRTHAQEHLADTGVLQGTWSRRPAMGAHKQHRSWALSHIAQRLPSSQPSSQPTEELALKPMTFVCQRPFSGALIALPLVTASSSMPPEHRLQHESCTTLCKSSPSTISQRCIT